LIEVEPQAFEGLQPTGLDLFRTAVDRDPSVTAASALLFQEVSRGEAATDLAIDGLATFLLGLVLRDSPRHSRAPGWLKEAEELLRASFCRTVGLAEVAASVDVSPTHLAHAFRRFRGETMGDFVRRLRVDRAGHLLRRSSLSLSDIAQEVGFCDQSHLTRVFRRCVGITPGLYRRLHGGRADLE
jgi:AraC-like DNA-binding protein